MKFATRQNAYGGTTRGMMLEDGTFFDRAPTGAFWGDPEPAQLSEIERDGECLVRRTVAGDLRGGLAPAIEIVFQ